MAMKFCSHCGAATLELRIPDGDTLPRFVCATCGTIHYQNPKIVVGCLPVWDERVLLCKRAIEPRYGLVDAARRASSRTARRCGTGALRETLEEADARVELGELYTVISLPQINQVYMMFRARLARPRFRSGHGEPRGAAVRRERDSVGGARVPDDRAARCAISFSIAGWARSRCT